MLGSWREIMADWYNTIYIAPSYQHDEERLIKKFTHSAFCWIDVAMFA